MNTQTRLDIDAIGRRASARRQLLHMEQEEVAVKSGMSRAYVSRLENGGVRNPKVADLAAIAEALGLSLDAGVPVQDVARQLGHTVQTCQRVYAHFIGDDLRRAAKALGKALRHRFSGPKRLPRANNGTQDEP